jgi:hypothetical protein
VLPQSLDAVGNCVGLAGTRARQHTEISVKFSLHDALLVTIE